MDRQGISSGSIDGKLGPQTGAALRAFQAKAGLPLTGALDEATLAQMLLSSPPLATYTTTDGDLTRLQPIIGTWLGKSRQTALDYETILELVAEKSHAHPNLIRTKLIIPPGPNNPVGTAWIGLDLPGYGIHGTPEPEHVGRTESHGCFRLANWNVEYLVDLVWVGMPVRVEQ
jgi:hypothetical protein